MDFAVVSRPHISISSVVVGTKVSMRKESILSKTV